MAKKLLSEQFREQLQGLGSTQASQILPIGSKIGTLALGRIKSLPSGQAKLVWCCNNPCIDYPINLQLA